MSTEPQHVVDNDAVRPEAERGAVVSANKQPRRATRNMYIAFIWINGSAVMFDLEIKNFPMTFHIAMSKDNPVIQAFADADGQIGDLLALQGQEAKFHFRDFTDNAWLELAQITRIQKLSGKA